MPDNLPATKAASFWHRALAVVGTLVLAAGCGGGTSQYDPFVPQRIFAFGDEASAVTADGHNWGVNGLRDANSTPTDTSDDVFDCSLAPNWAQALAVSFGLYFEECKPADLAVPQGRNYAAPLAQVEQVAVQVEQARVDAGGFRDKDLVSLMVGVNDVIDLYRQYTTPADADGLVREAGARGKRTAQIVNQLVAWGAKVVVANIPDVSLTPFARQQSAEGVALIYRLSEAFNQQLGVNLLIDGRYIGLVQFDQRTQLIARAPASFLFGNITDAACATGSEPPACTSNTVVDAAKTTAYLWASDRWLSAAGQSQLATMAIDRAHRNPF